MESPTLAPSGHHVWLMLPVESHWGWLDRVSSSTLLNFSLMVPGKMHETENSHTDKTLAMQLLTFLKKGKFNDKPSRVTGDTPSRQP